MQFLSSLIAAMVMVLLPIPSKAESDASSSVDAQIEQLNRWEMEALKSSLAIDKIRTLFQKTDPIQNPRVWLHAYALLTPDQQKELGLTPDELLEKARPLNDKALLVRLWLFKLKQQIASGTPKDEVLATFAAGDSICDGWQDPLWCGRWKMSLGWQYHVLNDEPSGLKVLESALRLLEKTDEFYAYFYHEAQTTLAILLQETGQSDRAMEMTRVNFKWYQSQGYLNEAAYEAYNLAYHLMENAKRDLPLIGEYLDEAENIAREVDNQDCLALIYYARGELAIDRKDFEAAIELLDRAHTSFKKLGNLEFRALTLIRKARALIALNQISRAKQSIEAATLILPKDYKFETMRILELRHLIAKKEGDMTLAHNLLEQYLEAFKEQTKDKEQREMQKLSTQLGLQVEEQRNKALQQQNALQAQELHEAEIFRGFVLGLSFLALCTLVLLVLALRQTARVRISRMKMQRILDHIDEGLLTIDKSLAISDDYSKRLPNILGAAGDIAGKNFLKEVFANSSLSTEDKSMIHEVMSAVLGEEKIAWDMNEEHLPREIRLGEGRERIVAMRWIPIFDSHEVLQRILVKLIDVTHERALEQAYGSQKQHLQTLPQILREMLQVAPDRMQNLLKQGRELLRLLDGEGSRDGLLRELHTLKGTARTLGLRTMSQDLHELESLLMPQKGLMNVSQVLPDHLLETKDRIREYQALAEVMHNRANVNNPLGKPWLGHAVDIHLTSWMQQMQDAGLPVASIHIQDDVIHWSQEDISLIEKLCLHAITNSLDHGFLLAKSKGRAVSPPKLRFDARLEQGRIHLQIRDNGVGLDPDKIQDLAQKRGFIPDAQQTIQDVLFLDGVSTSEHITLTSGRGIGLAAMKDLMIERGGRINIQNNESGPGTLLKMDWLALTAKHSDLEASA